MHFPKFWKLAKSGEVSAWGWSDVSVTDALAVGAKRVDRVIAWLKGERDCPEAAYDYPGRPMREEVLREFRAANGELIAAVTRNTQGCEVLNVANLLFVDIDEPQSRGGFFKSLFGKKPPGFEGSTLAKVGSWVAAHPDWGIRAYRTRAGIRLVATHKPYNPEDPVCAEVFAAFEADPLYRKLCASQKCFRARLTPKAWRCGLTSPGVRWPWRDAQAESEFKAWNAKYQTESKNFAVCRQLGHFGQSEIHTMISELVAFHDTAARVGANLPLA
ncbi:MAG TPA: hypothetical protein VFV96_11605 [Verrucomicrobiae bacterium]|nr:hypothetical protein [Verrucomicrobiae bacterium]